MSLNIAIVTRYQNYPGGVESVTLLLKKTFLSFGHTVTIISADTIKFNNLENLIASVTGEIPVYSRHLKKNLNTYDLIICNGEFGYGIDHPRCINLYHGSAYGYREALKGYLGPRSYLKLTRLALHQKSAAKKKTTVVVSDYLKEILSNQGIKINEVIEIGIDTNLFYPGKKEKKLDRYLFVGSTDFIGKGFDILQALAKKGFLIDCLTNHNPCQELQWLPPVPQNQAPAIYRKYKIFLFPSRFEGLGLAPLEAMASGLPIVMNPIGLGAKLKETIPEFVCETNDPEGYYQKALFLEKNYDHYCKKAREYVEKNYSMKHFSTKWNHLLYSLTENKNL